MARCNVAPNAVERAYYRETGEESRGCSDFVTKSIVRQLRQRNIVVRPVSRTLVVSD